MSAPIRIVKEVLEQQVQEGWKKNALAEHYGLPVAQMTKVLKDCGLTIRKFHAPKYVLVSEDVNENTAVNDTEVIEDVIVGEAQISATEEEVRTEEATQVAETAVPQGW